MDARELFGLGLFGATSRNKKLLMKNLFCLSAEKKVLLYFSLDYRGEIQELTFDQSEVHSLFYGSFHKVCVNVCGRSVSLLWLIDRYVAVRHCDLGGIYSHWGHMHIWLSLNVAWVYQWSIVFLQCDWQVHLSVNQVSVSLYVDCQRVGERPARPLGTLPTDGFEMLGKLVRTRGPQSGSAAVSQQHHTNII